MADDYRPPPCTLWPELTPRLIDVLRLLAEGYTDKQIGGQLGISHNTVRVHTTALEHNLRAVLAIPDDTPPQHTRVLLARLYWQRTTPDRAA